MKVRLVAFGIAKEIINASKIDFEVNEQAKIEELKESLSQKYPDFEKLRSLKFAVGEEYQADTYELQENDEVVIIPPVSGG